jgi:hypothetical protein
MALTIGFTNVYYTLWSVSEPFKKYDGQNAFSWAMQISYNYLQNLTMESLEAAEAKVQQMYPGRKYEIDLDLRGDNGMHFVKTMFKGNDCAQYMFAVGRLMGEDIRTFDINFSYFKKDQYSGEDKKITTTSYLWITYLKKNADDRTFMDLRRAVIARQRMVKEGILVKHTDGKYYTPDQVTRMAQIKGHHGVNGSRVTLNIKEVVKRNSYITGFGTMYIVNYMDVENRLYKYVGNNPPDVLEDYSEVKATIKHDNYKGREETKLQRITVAAVKERQKKYAELYKMEDEAIKIKNSDKELFEKMMVEIEEGFKNLA